MADTGWKYAANGRNIDVGQTNWNNPTNVCGATDDAWVDRSLSPANTTNELNAYNFSMNVPAGKQIDGINCLVYQLAAADIRDYHVYLMDDTSHKGENKADTSTDWPSIAAWASYGDASDLWNTSWTTTQVNASTFGIIVRAKNHHASTTRTAYVDSIAIKIYYSDVVSSSHLMMMGM